MSNEFTYWFSMTLIIAASVGLGLLVGYTIGRKRGVTDIQHLVRRSEKLI